MDELDGEAILQLDPEAFAAYLEKGRRASLGFAPSDEVKGRTLRVEQHKRNPSRKEVWLVLDTKGDSTDALGNLTSADSFPFVALSYASPVLIYESTKPANRLLYAGHTLQFDDAEGVRTVALSEISSSEPAKEIASCASPFTEQAYLDESVPLCSAYSLLIERTDEGFSQDVYLFLARGHNDALEQAKVMIDSALRAFRTSDLQTFLYFTGFDLPRHGQVMFDCSLLRNER